MQYHVISCVIGLFRPAFNKVGNEGGQRIRSGRIAIQVSFSFICRPAAGAAAAKKVIARSARMTLPLGLRRKLHCQAKRKNVFTYSNAIFKQYFLDLSLIGVVH
jgi:hypothetical protein